MSASPTIDTVLTVVTDFVTRTRGAAPIAADTRLLQEGHVDSFGLVELIAELEGRLGLDLPQGSLIPEDFETPRVLHGRLAELAA